MADIDLETGEALSHAATPPPWIYSDEIDGLHNVTQGGWDIASCSAGSLDPDYGDRSQQAIDNAKWVEWLGNNGAKLLEEVRRQDTRIRELENRAATADHKALRIWQERPGEFSFECACGTVNKHVKFGVVHYCGVDFDAVTAYSGGV